MRARRSRCRDLPSARGDPDDVVRDEVVDLVEDLSKRTEIDRKRIIAWVGIKLMLEYGHQRHLIAFELPTWFSLSLIVVIFTVAFLIARKVGPHEHKMEDAATKFLAKD